MENLRQRLLAMAEVDYQRFSASLLPETEHILGVRLPALRQLAKEIAHEDWRTYLRDGQEEYFEEIMLKGMVIGLAQAELPEKLCHIAQFVPKIDNWSVCDSFCTGLKMTQNHQQAVWQFLQPYMVSMAPYDLRFAVVMLLDYYINDEYIDRLLSALEQIKLPHYYVQMAVAWALSMCYVRYREQTMVCLMEGQWADFTYNKTLQKIIESRQVTEEERALMRSLKRHGKTP